MLSRRLKSIAGLLYKTDRVIDVGCDHALIDIYLIKNKLLDRIVISDVNQNALSNGVKNIKKYHLENKIDVRFGFGISIIDENIDTVIISGMGTNTIMKILSHPNLKYINKLIIQSNNDYYLLRKFVCSKGYYISYEAAVYDNGKYYINIVFLKGQKKYTNKELRYGPILMYANNEYFKFLLKKQIAILDHIPVHKFFTRAKIYREIIYLKNLGKSRN